MIAVIPYEKAVSPYSPLLIGKRTDTPGRHSPEGAVRPRRLERKLGFIQCLGEAGTQRHWQHGSNCSCRTLIAFCKGCMDPRVREDDYVEAAESVQLNMMLRATEVRYAARSFVRSHPRRDRGSIKWFVRACAPPGIAPPPGAQLTEDEGRADANNFSARGTPRAVSKPGCRALRDASLRSA